MSEAPSAVGEGVLANSDVCGNSGEQVEQLVPFGAGQPRADLVLPLIAEPHCPVKDFPAALG
jgi:hypothetical protein